MDLATRIQEDLKTAMRSKDKVTLLVLRQIKSQAKVRAIELKISDLNEEELLSVIQKLKKQRQDSIQQFKDAGRDDLVANESAEMVVMDKYLPQQLTEAELQAVVDKVYEEIKPASIKEMGKMMKAVIAAAAGRADGGSVNKLVRQKLS